jgi:hypothetical protein
MAAKLVLNGHVSVTCLLWEHIFNSFVDGAVWTQLLCFSLVPILGDVFSCSFSSAASYWLTRKAMMDRKIDIIGILLSLYHT